MKKQPFTFFLLAVFFLASASSLGEWQSSLYNQVKEEAVKGFENFFGRKVTIGQAEGIIVGQIVLKDMAVSGLAKARVVYLNFNPITYLLKKDILPALTKITVVDGNLNVERNRSGQWNVLSLFSQNQPAPTTPPSPRIKLVFNNCALNYLDQTGFRQAVNVFSAKIGRINGEVDLRKTNNISFRIAGKTTDNFSSDIKINGHFNPISGPGEQARKYQINLSASHLDLAFWGNYVVPIDPLNLREGEANVKLRILPPKTKDWPVALRGIFQIKRLSADFGDYQVRNAGGEMSMDDDSLSCKQLEGEINQARCSLNGSLRNFEKQNISLDISCNKTDLKNILKFFPSTAQIPASGKVNVRLHLSNTLRQPSLSGKISAVGSLFSQNFSGDSSVSFTKGILHASSSNLRCFEGKISGNLTADFSQKIPVFSLASEIKGINLNSLSQKSPGIVGILNGQFELSGPANQLTGKLSSSLSNALFLGQPIEALNASFLLRDGNVYLDSFSAASKAASLSAVGTIRQGMLFDFQSTAHGIRLSGRGILGKMEALVDSFKGNMCWKLDENFLKFPLRNLTASGEVALSGGKLGEQEFDSAHGKIAIGSGLIQVNHATIRKNNSILQASGQAGIGYPTLLFISGESLALGDLKIINHFLPQEAQNPTGTANIEIIITGELPPETNMASFDSLLDLDADGTLFLAKSKIAEIPIEELRLKALWSNHELLLSECRVKLTDSALVLSGSYGHNGEIAGNLNGILNLAHLKKLPNRFGTLDGILWINLNLAGQASLPKINADFRLNNFMYNNIFLSSVEGGVNLDGYKLKLAKPLTICGPSYKYIFSGWANLEGLYNANPEECEVGLSLDIIESRLSEFIPLVQKSQGIFFGKLLNTNKSNVSIYAFSPFPPPESFAKADNILLYSINGRDNYLLKTWLQLCGPHATEESFSSANNLNGIINGSLFVNGKLNDLSGGASAEVSKASIYGMDFDAIRASASLKDNQLKINALEISKAKGEISASGKLNLNGELGLSLTASNFPLDILKAVFDRDIQGNFNAQASVEGAIFNPRISLSASAKNINLAGIPFNNLQLVFSKNNENLYIRNFSLQEGNNLSTVSGLFNLAPDGKMKLKANIKDNACGLINLLSSDILWISGKADITATLEGTKYDPHLSGSFNFNSANLGIKALNAKIMDISGHGTMDNGILDIPNLGGFFRGYQARGFANPIALAGTLDFRRLFDNNPSVNLNLSFSPTEISLNLPNLYLGWIEIKEASLSGPLFLDLSKGPTFTGACEFHDGIITLPSRPGPREKALPVGLALKIGLGKNTYAAMGDVNTLNLSNIFMNLELISDELLIAGNSVSPRITGKIQLPRGTVNIFNREFSLLSEDEQKQFYPYNPERIKNNLAVFSGEEGESGLMPNVTITSKVEVEDQQTDASGQTVKKKVIVLANLNGVIGATEKERGLNTSFASFTEDAAKSPPEFTPAGYSEQDIKVLLLPDFIKSLAGINKAGGSDVNSNAVIADYLSSRVQTIFFRSISRPLEEALGLESLTLDYNFGKDIKQAMGIKEDRILGQQPDWRFGFVKGFFDKLFIDMRFSQAFEQTTAKPVTNFNYQITYKLSPIWSIIYYREPATTTDLTYGYQKITLKTGFSFW